MSVEEKFIDTGMTPITSYEFSKKSFLTELCTPSIVYVVLAILGTGTYVGFNLKTVNIPRTFGEFTCIVCCAFLVSIICKTKPINLAWILALTLLLCNGSLIIGNHYKEHPTVRNVRGTIAGFTSDEIQQQAPNKLTSYDDGETDST